MSQAVVRPATPADVPALTQIDQDSWDSHNSPADLTPVRPFSMALDRTWVATRRSDGAVVGYVTLGRRTALPSHQHVVIIQSIAVARTARRTGLGSLLLDTAKAQARTLGGRKLSLNVLGTNPAALALYRRNGFGQEAHYRREFHLDGQDVDDHVLSFDLHAKAPAWCTGACHCGAVRFEVYVRKWEVLDCNCSVCTRKGILHLIVENSDFRLTQGADALTTYTFGTHTAKHHFCRTCGMHPFYVPRSHPDGWDVNVRCLTDVPIDQFARMPFDGRQWESKVDGIR